jgi:hypothetical protein
LVFEIVKKGENGWRVEIGDTQGRGLDASGLFDKGQQQAEGVTATGHGLRAGAFMPAEMVGKAGLDVGSKG